MAEVLGAATSATKLFLEVNQISIDNFTFKLFYKATTTLLVACSVIASSKQFFGDPINCEVNGGGVSQSVLDAYCWMYATFYIPKSFEGSCAKKEHDGATLYNSYYQWVSIFLVVSAILFYLPRAIWLMAEGGLMKFLAKGTTTKIIEDASEKREKLLKTFTDHLHNKYNAYAFWFFMCEQMNFIVVLSQWFITNKFLKYTFLGYGMNVVQYYNIPPEERDLIKFNPMCEAFPRIAACNYHRYGSGGGQEVKNAICILGLNMINDKIFLFLWFWYLFLTFFGSIRFIYRIFQLSSRHFRYVIMKVRIHRYFKANASMKHVKHYIQHCPIGDWFVLYQMSRNMNTRFFAEFLVVLSRQVNPCPGIDDDSECEDLIKLTSGKLSKNNSTLSLHSKILDLTYDAGGQEEEKGGGKKEEKEEEKEKEEEVKEKEDETEEESEVKEKKKRELEDNGDLKILAGTRFGRLKEDETPANDTNVPKRNKNYYSRNRRV